MVIFVYHMLQSVTSPHSDSLADQSKFSLDKIKKWLGKCLMSALHVHHFWKAPKQASIQQYKHTINILLQKETTIHCTRLIFFFYRVHISAANWPVYTCRVKWKITKMPYSNSLIDCWSAHLQSSTKPDDMSMWYLIMSDPILTELDVKCQTSLF